MSKNTAFLEDCREDFKLLSQHSQDVVRYCNRSSRSEEALIRALKKFIKLTIIALRAARLLKNEYPADSFVKDYLIQLVGISYDETILELDSEDKS